MHKIYLTTPIYYVNASPHIGHAYTNVIADCLARYKRMLLGRENVFFLTGTDEHGEKIKKVAQSSGKTPDEFVDEVSENFKSLWKRLNVDFDYFIRTTDAMHQQAVKEAVRLLRKNGDIYLSRYEGFYCMPCETFWTKEQLGDNAVCPDCSRQVEQITEENYFFRLSKYQAWLMEHLKKNPEAVQPKIRYNEVMGFLENNTLQDLCVSRPKERVSWGIGFPDDEAYVVYVWFDALLNYISAVKFGIDNATFEKWWPADIHFIGKDILRQHAIIWPIMLKALGVKIPRMVFAHGWWKIGQEKMSKSLGNIVNPLELIERIGVDALRYFLLREVAVGSDGNYSWPLIINRVNADLANDLGNLVFRVLNMAEKYCGGKVKCPGKKDIPKEFHAFVGDFDFCHDYIRRMDAVDFSGALEEVWKFIKTMNKFIEDTKPWALKKEGKLDELEHFLWSLLQGIQIVSVYIYPFMPDTAAAICRQLGQPLGISEGIEKGTRWSITASFEVRKETPLFPRIDVD